MECDGHLQAAGLLADSVGEVAHLLEQWEGGEEEWNNGVVVELGRKFKCPEVMNAATMLVACLVGMNLQCLNRSDKKRIQYYLASTERKMTSTGATAKEPWVYLAALKPGGQLSLARQHLFSQPTIYEALVSRLAALCTGEDVACDHCHTRGDYKVCKATFPPPTAANSVR